MQANCRTTQVDVPQYQINSLDIDLYTMTNYDDSFKEIDVLYPKVTHNKHTR